MVSGEKPLCPEGEEERVPVLIGEREAGDWERGGGGGGGEEVEGREEVRWKPHTIRLKGGRREGGRAGEGGREGGREGERGKEGGGRERGNSCEYVSSSNVDQGSYLRDSSISCHDYHVLSSLIGQRMVHNDLLLLTVLES